MDQLLESHWIEVKLIIRYLNGIAYHSLLIGPVESVQQLFLEAYKKILLGK